MRLSPPARFAVHVAERQKYGMRVPKDMEQAGTYTNEDFEEFNRRRAAQSIHESVCGPCVHAHAVVEVCDFSSVDDQVYSDSTCLNAARSPGGVSCVGEDEGTALPAFEPSAVRGERIFVQLVHPNATVPSRATSESGGLDLYAVEDGVLINDNLSYKVDVGIRILVPKSCFGHILGRSGLAARHVTTRAGVIDRDYRGDIIVVLANSGSEPLHYKRGQAIAQLVLTRCSLASAEIVDCVDSDTERGAKGFGSSDAAMVAAMTSWDRTKLPLSKAQQGYDRAKQQNDLHG